MSKFGNVKNTPLVYMSDGVYDSLGEIICSHPGGDMDKQDAWHGFVEEAVNALNRRAEFLTLKPAPSDLMLEAEPTPTAATGSKEGT